VATERLIWFSYTTAN